MTPESVDAAAADRKFRGSCMIYEGESIDAVRQLVEEDLYYKTDVVRLGCYDVIDVWALIRRLL